MILRYDRVALLDAGGLRKDQTLVAAAGRWIYVGPASEAPSIRGRTPSLPPGALLLPPFVDTHMHLVGWGLEHLLPELAGPDLDSVFDRIREGVERHPEWEAYVFWGLDETLLREGRLPTREELDRVLPDRPLVVRRVCGHVAVLNTRALEKIPRKDEFVDETSGRVMEHWALRIRDLFPPAPQERDEAFLLAQEHALRQGILMVHDFGDLEAFRTLLRAWQDGALVLKVRFYLYDEDRAALQRLSLPAGFGDDRLQMMGIKLFLDGSVGGRTAAFEAPYADTPDTRGVLLYSDRKLLHRLRWARERGLGVALHAIGDRAIHQAVRVLSRLQKEGWSLRKIRLEHVEFPSEEVMDALSDLGVALSVQPNFKSRWGQPGGMYEHRLGKERASRNNPLARFVARQLPHAYGSDGMPFDVLYLFQAALREVPFHEVLHRITGAAYALSGEEAVWGFRPGARACAQVVVLQEGAQLPLPPAGWILDGEFYPSTSISAPPVHRFHLR